jgi:hypothetical protein
MDDRTQQVLRLINSHLKIKNYLTTLCYFLIISGLFFYVFYAINKTHNSIKFVSNYHSDSKHYKATKIMTNPRIDFQYNDKQVYHIKAETAYHENDQEVTMYNVAADGELGSITAGELEISEEGERLIFSNHPVLILNQTENQ